MHRVCVRVLSRPRLPRAVKARRQNKLNTEFLKYYEQKKNNLAAERSKRQG